MSRLELRLKPTKNNPPNELETFVNTVYDNFIHEITNLENSLKSETEPLHYLITKIKIETMRDALKMYDSVVDKATEFQEIEVEENEKNNK